MDGGVAATSSLSGCAIGAPVGGVPAGLAGAPTADRPGAGTTITIRHTGPWSTDEPVESYREGWSFVLAALARALD